MRLALCLMGVELMALEINHPATPSGPGDATAVPMGAVGFGTWERPTIPALELD